MGVARVLAVALAALVVAACAGDDPGSGGPTVAASTPGLGSAGEVTTAEPPEANTRASETTGVPPSLMSSPTTAPAAPVPPPPDPCCAPGPDRVVTDLADATVEAVVVPDYSLTEQRLGDFTIPAVRVPGFTIPAHIVDNAASSRTTRPRLDTHPTHSDRSKNVELNQGLVAPFFRSRRTRSSSTRDAGSSIAAPTLFSV